MPTSRATRVTSSANEESWSTIVLIVFFSCRISPLTSTVILRPRSPSATAVVTSAMLRTWPVRFDAMKLTLSVRSFHTPETPSTRAWPPRIPSVPTSRATRVTSARERAQLVDHRVDGLLQLEDLAAGRDRDLLGEIALRDRGRHVGDVADLERQVVRERVDVVGEVLPRPAHALDLRLAAELAFRADLLRDARHLVGERAQLVDHRVDRVLELEHLALDVDGDLLGEVAGRDGGRHFGDVAHLSREVGGERVDVVREVLPARPRRP